MNSPCDDNSPIPASGADLCWDPGSYPTISWTVPLDVSGYLTLNIRNPISWTAPLAPTYNTHWSFLIFPISDNGTAFLDAPHKILWIHPLFISRTAWSRSTHPLTCSSCLLYFHPFLQRRSWNKVKVRYFEGFSLFPYDGTQTPKLCFQSLASSDSFLLFLPFCLPPSRHWDRLPVPLCHLRAFPLRCLHIS